MIKTYFYSHDEKRMHHDVNLHEKDNFLKHEEDLLWVDLYNFTEQEIKDVARIFNFHPLAVEDCLTYSPRAKLDNYEDYYTGRLCRYWAGWPGSACKALST